MSGWIKATINDAGGHLSYVTKEVWVGRPQTPTTDPSWWPFYEMNLYDWISPNVTSAPGASSTDYTWSCSGSLTMMESNPAIEKRQLSSES